MGLQKFKLSTRILSLGVVITVCFALVFAWVIPRIRTNLYEAKYTKTKHVVEAAHGTVNYFVRQAKTGGLPLEEAKTKAKEAIKTLRYDHDDYFWINDLEPRMIMHPMKPEMDGKNIGEEKDPHGKRFFVAMAEICRKDGAGFVDYSWPKPGVSQPVPKVSYVKLVPEWGWVIGSGIYIDDVAKEINQILLVIFSVVGAIAAGCLLLAYMMARSISRPIAKVIEGLTEGADQVASAASQVSSASQSLAEGASEQAAGLEETSASMEEMSSMTKQNAENAQAAKAMTSEAGQVVENVNHHMEKMGEAIGQITKSSEETGKIIKTIDEIAFQTNLLALNAAVEAARAGEAGAGFAVVADEVRNLAMRASEAAKNTSHLIESTIKSIKTGNDLTLATREAFKKNVEISKKISRLIDEIAAASQEQAQGIGQVSKAVAEMDKVVQQNAANAEESASAAEEMNSQAEQMKAYMRELDVIVGGRGEDERRTVSHHPEEKGRITPAARMEKPPGKGKTPRIASLPDQKGKGERPLDPRQVLPLEEGDFKAF